MYDALPTKDPAANFTLGGFSAQNQHA